MHPDRHLKAPWFRHVLTDIRAQGPPEAETFTGDDAVIWLHVRSVEPHWLALRLTATGRWLVHIPPDTST